MNLIGQKLIVNYLKDTIDKDKIGHFYIFAGNSGLGKGYFAELFIKAVNCREKAFPPCRNCKNCMGYKGNPDLHILEKKDDKLSIGADETREFIDKLYLKPAVFDRVCVIIRDGDILTPQAQSILLKVLEEPPPYVTVILLVQNEEALLKTVRSRGVVLRFLGYSKKEMAQILHDKQVPAHIINLAGGSVGLAISLSGDLSVENLRLDLFKLIKGMQNGLYEALSLQELIKKENHEMALYFLLTWFRDIFCAKINAPMLNTDLESEIKVISMKISLSGAVRCLDIIRTIRNELSKSSNFDLWICDLILLLWEEINGINRWDSV